MNIDRKHHNFLMLQLRRLRESGATTIDTKQPTLFAAVQRARQVLEMGYSHLTGREQYLAEIDVGHARWALSVTQSSAEGHATQRASVENAVRPEPVINEDSAELVVLEPDVTDLEAIVGSMSQEEWTSIMLPEEASKVTLPNSSSEESSADRPLLQELFSKRLTKDNLKVALRKTQEWEDNTKDTIERNWLRAVAQQYGGRPPADFAQDWKDLMRALEDNGLAIRLDNFHIRLTEQGKAWLNEAPDSTGAEEAMDAQITTTTH